MGLLSIVDLNSVERVVEYLDLPQEPPAVIESNRPPAYWPSASTTDLVTVEDLTIRYAPELPDVLHEVSFSLRPKERVGLLGRTGSGKSTLAMALLRFVDPTSGKIIIDGIDISTIGLQDLRSRVVRPAVLSEGLRDTDVDPLDDYSARRSLVLGNYKGEPRSVRRTLRRRLHRRAVAGPHQLQQPRVPSCVPTTINPLE